MQSQSPTRPSPFQYHLHNKHLNLDERRFRKCHVTHLKTSKSISFETNDDESIHQHIKECQKVLKAQNRLSKLHFTLDNLKQIEKNLLLSTIRHFSSLSSLNVELSGNFQNDISSQEILLKSLVSLHNLRHVDLSFFCLALHDAKTLKNLMKTIRKLRRISSLFLTFFSCSGQTPLHYNVLLLNLAKMTQLRTLKLNLDNSEDLDTQDLDIFTVALPKLSFLTQLDIAFEGTWTFQEPTLLKLLGAFQSMKNLTDLAIDLGGCRFSYYYYEAGSILESLKCLVGTSIRKLRLGLFQNFVNQNLRELSATLKELNLLQSLSLYFFSRSSLIEDLFADFGSALACLVSLTSLSLYYPSGVAIKNIVQISASALMSLQNLEFLKLAFGLSNEAEDQQFQTLCTNLKSLKSLKYLDIQVANQKKITNTSLEVFGESLKGLNLLKDLSLDFSSADLITNQGIEALCYAIQEGLPNLFGLSLKFEENPNINEKVMSKLAETLRSLALLYSVELCFLRCVKIIDCKDLFNALRGMKNLEEVKLSLPYSEENSREVCDLGKIKDIISFNLF